MQIIIYAMETFIYYYGHVLNTYYGLTLISIIIDVLFRMSEFESQVFVSFFFSFSMWSNYTIRRLCDSKLFQFLIPRNYTVGNELYREHRTFEQIRTILFILLLFRA